ncbi:MAG TPA: hypothetical protein VG478_14850, partial [Acidimicrobiales bacterium]|nr:hypothetical protein [Acidimicrobiales bacterium]
MRVPPAAPLPAQLPPAPAMPESYAQPYRKQLAAKSLDLTQQAQLFAALKIHANVDEDRDEAIELIHALRDRQDVTAAVLREIEQFLGTERPVQRPAARAAAAKRQEAASGAAKDAAPEPVKKPAKRQKAEPLKLPFGEVVDLVKAFAAADLYVSPDIPDGAEDKARTALEIPKNEPVVALLNLAWFSAGANALVVTDRAVHHRKLGVGAHIPFDELADSQISVQGTYVVISDHHLSVGSTAAGMPKIESLLKTLAAACRRARSTPD